MALEPHEIVEIKEELEKLDTFLVRAKEDKAKELAKKQSSLLKTVTVDDLITDPVEKATLEEKRILRDKLKGNT